MPETSRMPRLVGRGGSSAPFVLLSPLSSGRTQVELDVAWSLRPDGFALAGAVGRADLDRLGVMLSVREAEDGLPDGALRVVAVATDSAAGLLAIRGFAAGGGGRLAGIACDPERLRAQLGCEPDAAAIAHAHVMTVIGAAAAGVPAVLVAPGGLSRAEWLAAKREGFEAALVGNDEAAALAAEVF